MKGGGINITQKLAVQECSAKVDTIIYAFGLDTFSSGYNNYMKVSDVITVHTGHWCVRCMNSLPLSMM